MELKIEHIAPYLPYSLKYTVQIKDLHPEAPFEERELTLWSDGIELCLKHGKPLLRPLSDLNKEEHCVFEDPTYNQDIGILMSSNATKIDIDQTQWVVIKQLLSWHFDIFGLIEKGLALDKNKLKERA